MDATRRDATSAAPAAKTRTDESFTVAGRCLDGAGHALSGVHVEVLGLRRSADGGIKPLDTNVVGTSDANGRFELHFSPPKTESSLPLQSVGIEGRLSRYSAVLAEVRPAGPGRFEAGDLILERSVALGGVVHDPLGAPEEDATIQLWRQGVSGSLQKHADQAITAHDGTFSISDSPAGAVTLIAKTSDGRESGRLELSLLPGEHKADIEILVPLFDDPLAITGVVVDANDQPVAKAKISFTYHVASSSGASDCTSDARGRFRIQGRAGELVTLRAVSPDPSVGAAIAKDVAIGTHGLRLVLSPIRPITLHVHDGSGQPIERFGWTSREVGPVMTTVVETQAEAAHAGGDAQIRADGDPLAIEVVASGYETVTVGPFALATAGSVIDVSMHGMPSIHGIVVERDVPVPNANVSMLECFARNESHVQGTLDLTHLPCDVCPGTRTDAKGRFTLPASKIGRFVIRAAPQDRPPALSDEFEVRRDGADVDVRVEVQKGGAIEGVVKREGGPPESDWTVIASSGDGSPYRTTTDKNGHYRFDGLAPGGWQMRTRRAIDDVEHGGMGSQQFTGHDAPSIRWDCVVASGEVTPFDVILPASSLLVLELGPPFDSGNWTPVIQLDCPSIGSGRPSRLVQDAMHWSVELECTGEADLSVSGARDGGSWTYEGPLKIEAGHNDKRVEFDTGDVEGHVADAQAGSTRVLLMWQNPSVGWSASTRVTPDTNGRFRIPHAPAGSCTLRVEGTSNTRERKIDVAAGSHVEVGDL